MRELHGVGSLAVARRRRLLREIGAALALLVALGGAPSGQGKEAMSAITLDLQDGFVDDLVVITAEGREVARAEGVTTRVQIGLARSLQLDIPARPTELLIAVPTKDASVTVTVDPEAASHVGVSLSSEGELKVRVAQQPFGYL